MSSWTFSHIENYCMFESRSEKEHQMYKLNLKTGESKKSIKRLNKDYIHKSNRPSWCRADNKKLIPRFRCMCDGKNDKRCPFFSMCDCDPKDYKLFDKAYNKKMKGEEE